MTDFAGYPTLSREGRVTHVMVPVEEFHRMQRMLQVTAPSEGEVATAVAILASAETSWHTADDVLLDLVRDGVEPARRSRGMTQWELGKAAGLSQSQISRIEQNPDHAAMSVLRRLARALAGRAQ